MSLYMYMYILFVGIFMQNIFMCAGSACNLHRLYSKVKQALYWEHGPFGYLHTKGGLTIIFACVSLQLEVQIILYALL